MGNDLIPETGKIEENSLSILERAEKAAKEINEGISKLEKLKQENEMIASRITLSGKSYAGQVAAPPAEMTPQEMASKLMKGEINPF